jgi:tRNA-modifying protein YgfZ
MHELLRGLPGAVVDENGLRHLGNPMGEQRMLADGRALAALGDRRVISVAGEDRLSWLDSLTSQALAHLPVAESTELLVLDPNGRIEHAASVVDDGETAWLIVDAADADGLASWLTKMRFRLRVDIRTRDDLAVVGGTASALDAVQVIAPHDVAVRWRDPWPYVAPGGWAYAASDAHPGGERDWTEGVVDAAELSRLVADDTTTFAGIDAANALRVAAWRPRVTVDADERALPHELDWLRTAVHLSKGCYRGQETVAKVHNLGHPPRRVVALHLDGSDSVLPATGDPVRAGDTVVGAVTSAARHYEEGPIALALIKRTAPIDTDLVVDTADGPVAAAQQIVVPPEAGATAGVPRLPRLGRRTA